MGWIAALIASLFGMSVALSPRKKSSTKGGSNMSDPDYTPDVWEEVIAAVIAGDARYSRCKVAAAKAWLTEESGGNPCAWGDPPPIGTAENGDPKEIGIGQLYNPDDFKTLKISSAPLRAYCKPGTQIRTRKLTDQEMIDQVRYTVLEPMLWGLEFADEAVKTYGLSAWSEVDFWKLVKVKHAYKPILAMGMPAVVKHLGHAPESWIEFRQLLGMDDDAVRRKALAHETLAANERTKWLWMRALDNCEKIGNSVAATGVV